MAVVSCLLCDTISEIFFFTFSPSCRIPLSIPADAGTGRGILTCCAVVLNQAEVHKGVVQAVFVHIVGHIVGGGFGFRAAAAQSHAVP